MTVITWTDDRVEQLKKLWEAGLSASQIAAELGNVTRNAVIGKVHRLGLSGRAKSPSSAAPRPRKARPAQHMMRVSRPVSRGNTALAHAFEVELEPDPISYDNVVPMMQHRRAVDVSRAARRRAAYDAAKNRKRTGAAGGCAASGRGRSSPARPTVHRGRADEPGVRRGQVEAKKGRNGPAGRSEAVVVRADLAGARCSRCRSRIGHSMPCGRSA